DVQSAGAINLDIKPGDPVGNINLSSNGVIPVAILSNPGFDATTQINATSLTFGPTGNETGPARSPDKIDINQDGLLDLVCYFQTKSAGFKIGDVVGILKGKTTQGDAVQGWDAVRIMAR